MVVACVVAMATACAGSWLARYREAHPDWRAELPVAGQGVDEVLAGLWAPDGLELHRIVASLELLRCDTGPCRRIRVRGVSPAGFEPAPGANYAIVAQVFCTAKTPDSPIETVRGVWYWLPAGRLRAWDHVGFGERCDPQSEYRPLRAARADVEVELAAAAGHAEHPPEHGATAEYQRGMSLVGAGRVDDARAALRRGDALLQRAAAHSDAAAGPGDLANVPYPRAALAAALAQRSGAKTR